MVLAILAWGAWACLSPVVYGIIGWRLLSPGDPAAKRDRLSAVLRSMPLTNSLFGGLAPAWLWASGFESIGLSAMAGGVAFMAGATVAQWANSTALCQAARRYYGFTGTKGEFSERAIARALLIAIPVGTTSILFGAGYEAFNGEFGAFEPLTYAGAIAIWGLQWGLLRRLTLPGRWVEFPNRCLVERAVRLAQDMNAPFTRLLLVRTKFAAAFALGHGKVAITDGLAACLDENELLAVIAHELQHFRQRLGTVCLSLFSVLGAIVAGSGLAFAARLEVISPSVALGVSCGVAVLSFLPQWLRRRRNEDDADAVAARLVGGDELASALEKVARANGDPLGRGDWLHRPLQERVARLRTAPAQDGILRPQAGTLAAKEWTGT
jgi:Zn-dependent protease with chaperone function